MDTLVKGDVTSGWTIKSRHGLQHILSNPMYAGHLVFNGSIVKMNAHQAIVDPDNWLYAFEHLADVDLEGNEIKREKRSVRYTQRGNTNDALLTGTRDNGTVVIDGVNGAHVHYNAATKAYTLWQHSVPTVSGFETSITTKELDGILESRLFHWLNAAERQEQYNDEHQYTSPGHSPIRAMGEIKDVQPKGQTGVQDDLNLTNQELASVQRALQFQDSMSDERLDATLKKEKRLIKRRAELEQVRAHGEQLARQREQAKEDVETAASKWSGWFLDKRRSFIRMVTDSITMEEIASGWLRLTIIWSPIMGFIYPLTSSIRATDTAYIWRDSGTVWTDEEMDTLRALYPTLSQFELLRLLPSRSWNSIKGKAIKSGISRKYGKHESAGLAPDTSLTDEQVLSEFMLKRERIQWKHDFLYNGGDQS